MQKRVVWPKLTSAPVTFITLETFEKAIPAKYTVVITKEVII
jgi:hypothetical protein